MKPGQARLEVLIIDALPAMARHYKSCLEPEGYSVRAAASGEQGLASLEAHPAHVIVVDLDLPDMRGIDLVRECLARAYPVGFVVATANGSIQAAVEAIRAGAHDFIVKPFSAERILGAVRNASDLVNLKQDLTRLKNDLDRRNICGIVGQSKAMKQVFSVLESAAVSGAAVFITGESGTGKELAAEAIHSISPRRTRPFVAVNCGAIPVDLVESEMFGHLRGSFTGAVADRKGAVQQADGGTLFLDEICEMPIDMQAKLLRFLQSGAVRPVGATRTEQMDVRIVCATNRHPMEEVKAGRFREDLYYRLHVLPVHMPPLRDREEDILMLAEHFLKDYATREDRKFVGYDPGARLRLSTYAWPGNIRQMQNVLRHAVVMNNAEWMTADMLPMPEGDETAGAQSCPAAKLAGAPLQLAASDPGSWNFVHDIVALADVEQAAVERAIDLCGGNIPRAAAFLSVSPSTIYRKLKIKPVAARMAG